jgi:hypothetical protein
MLVLLLLACLDTSVDDSGKDTDPDTGDTCDTLVAALYAEAAEVRACTDASECGQPIVGTSCGCTNNWVARADADLSALAALLEQVGAEECDAGLESDCSCPAAYGYACEGGECTWDYADASAGLPDCRADAGAGTTFDAVAVSGDELVLDVSYGGGCGAHAFTLCWPEPTFMESSPVQVDLEVFHDSGGDDCDAWISEEVRLDLTPLKDAWVDAYRATTGEITVHVHGYTVSYTF